MAHHPGNSQIAFGAWLLSAAALLPVKPARCEEKRPAPRLPEISSQLDQLATQVKSAADRLKLVETEYSQRVLTDEELMLHRFSDAEIQYLLGNFSGALVLFYDLIGDAGFKRSPHYPDALFYLAEGLYQQKNYLSAKVYLRELLPLKSSHYGDALSRYLEIANRTNDFSNIDEYVEKAKSSSGQLPPELSYLYGKWLYKRTDLESADKLKRLTAAFQPLADDPKGKFRLRSAYFLAVADVQRRDYPAAVEKFSAIAKSPGDAGNEPELKTLAHLSMGRVLFEMGKYDEAINQYQEVPLNSSYFPESLYEIAWTRVKKGQYQLAKDTTDILLMVAPNSTLTPDAQLLQGHLLLKLGKYGEAAAAYRTVIDTYGPVRDRIDSLLYVNQDPIAYFDGLLAKSERAFDVTSLLPPIALKWATSQREVADAVHMVGDLESSGRGVVEDEKIAQQLLKTLDQRGLSIFPALQEGFGRADSVDGSLAVAERSLIELETELVENVLTPEERSALIQLRAQQADLIRRFASLPQSEEEREARKKRMLERLDQDDKDLFNLGYTIQSMMAESVAMNKLLDDTHSNAKGEAAPEVVEFRLRIKEQVAVATGLQGELDQLRRTVAEERASLNSLLSGEESIRANFRAQIDRQHELLAPAESRVSPAVSELLNRAHSLRNQMGDLDLRVLASKKNIHEQVALHGKLIRDKIATEQARVAAYRQEMGLASKGASQVVGRIAYDSFKRLRPQFYDLVLNADVGVVDIAFTHKQNKTTEIQDLSFRKDRDLQALDRDFKDVLKDVD